MNGAGLFFLLLLLLVILPLGGWIAFVYFRAKRQGLPPPRLADYNPLKAFRSQSNYPIAPRPTGIVGWVTDKFHALKPSRNRGAYESTTNLPSSGGQGRGFGPLSGEDGAWDSRVGGQYGPEYEEQELGLHPPPPTGRYGHNPYERDEEYGVIHDAEHEEPRGRSRSRDDTEYRGAGATRENPFGDNTAERSDLRGVSPRPVLEGDGQSIKNERRSVFREAM